MSPEISLLRRVRSCTSFLLMCLICGCSSGSTEHPILTYTLSRQPFVIAVQAEGVLEAKVAQTLVVPRLRQWRQLEISHLALEGSQVKKGDMVVQFDPQAFENDYLSALNTLELAQVEAQRQAAQSEAQRLTMEAEMESARAAAAVSKLQVAKLEFVAPRLREIKRLEMKRDELRTEKIRKRLASNAVIQKEEAAHQKIMIQQAERKLKQAQEALDQLVIKAPTDGIVVYEESRWRDKKPQEGDVLYPGETVAKIPDLSVMQVKLKVGEIPAQKVKTGQRAEVDISSLPNGRITGKVTQVAKRAQPIKRGSNVKEVEVVVELDTTRADFAPGLSARVRILAGEAPDVLVAPLDCVFQKDSVNVVYVRKGDTFEPRSVTLVSQNANFAVITGDDVADGAALALREPEVGHEQ